MEGISTEENMPGTSEVHDNQGTSGPYEIDSISIEHNMQTTDEEDDTTSMGETLQVGDVPGAGVEVEVHSSQPWVETSEVSNDTPIQTYVEEGTQQNKVPQNEVPTPDIAMITDDRDFIEAALMLEETAGNKEDVHAGGDVGGGDLGGGGDGLTFDPARGLQIQRLLLELVEEVRMRRVRDVENEERIKQLVKENNDIENQYEDARSHLASMEQIMADKVAQAKREKKNEIQDLTMAKAKLALMYESNEKEVKALKNEVRTLQLSKYTLERKIREQERKLATKTMTNQDHVSQLAEFQKKCDTISKRAALSDSCLDRLEKNVKESVALNKKLSRVNEHQSCEMKAYKDKVHQLNMKLNEAKVELALSPLNSLVEVEFNLQITALNKQLSDALANGKALELKLKCAEEDFKNIASRLIDSQQLIFNQVESRNKTLAELSENQATIDRLTDKYEQLKTTHEQLKASTEHQLIEEAEKYLQLTKKNEDLEEHLSSLTGDYEELTKLKTEAENVNVELAEINRELDEERIKLQGELNKPKSDVALQACVIMMDVQVSAVPGVEEAQSQTLLTSLSTTDTCSQTLVSSLSTTDTCCQTLVSSLSTTDTCSQTLVSSLSTSDTCSQTLLTSLSTTETCCQTLVSSLSTTDTCCQTRVSSLSTTDTCCQTRLTSLSTTDTCSQTRVTSLSTTDTCCQTRLTRLSTTDTCSQTRLTRLPTTDTCSQTPVTRLSTTGTCSQTDSPQTGVEHIQTTGVILKEPSVQVKRVPFSVDFSLPSVDEEESPLLPIEGSPETTSDPPELGQDEPPASPVFPPYQPFTSECPGCLSPESHVNSKLRNLLTMRAREVLKATEVQEIPQNTTRSPDWPTVRKVANSPKTLKFMTSPDIVKFIKPGSNRVKILKSPDMAKIMKSPNIVTKSPNIVTKSPDMVTKSPNIVTKSPDMVTKSPDMVPESPHMVPKSPAMVTKSPDKVTKTPNMLTRSKNVVTKSPDMLTKSKNMLINFPEIIESRVILEPLKRPQRPLRLTQRRSYAETYIVREPGSAARAAAASKPAQIRVPPIQPPRCARDDRPSTVSYLPDQSTKGIFIESPGMIRTRRKRSSICVAQVRPTPGRTPLAGILTDPAFSRPKRAKKVHFPETLLGQAAPASGTSDEYDSDTLFTESEDESGVLGPSQLSHIEDFIRQEESYPP